MTPNNNSKTDEIVDAMMKIDAKLVAYLAGEEMIPKEEAIALERLQCTSPANQLVEEMMQERFREQRLKIYQRVNMLKMHLEALTLQPAGTKYMELLEEDIKPIFTVECQLSRELIRHVPRYEMFHVMQFESGHFQSLTQCTRFAQDEQREIHLLPKQTKEASDEKAPDGKAEMELEFGKLSFVVWWRQPGTCLNEMLGLAEFDLEELYQASLLEQCKCLEVKRRNVHMASLYFKVGLQLRSNSNGEENMQKEELMAKECNGAAGGEGGAGIGVEGGDAVLCADEKPSTNKGQKPAEAKNMENTAARGGDEIPGDKVADMKKGS